MIVVAVLFVLLIEHLDITEPRNWYLIMSKLLSSFSESNQWKYFRPHNRNYTVVVEELQHILEYF